MQLALPFLFLLWAFGSKGRDLTTRSRLPPPPPEPTVRRRTSRPSPRLTSSRARTTPPWPQVVPSGVPRFPGKGWEADEPPPKAVQARASALLRTLWKRGAGAFKTEQTAGRWITYRATKMGSKKGVVAYRLSSPGKRATARTQQRSPVVPAVSTAVRTTPVHTRVPDKPPGSPLAMPVLRYGIGMPPASPVDEVRIVQRKLGIKADGRFGSGTRAAVRSFQRKRSLSVDGVVGRNTWIALFSATA